MRRSLAALALAMLAGSTTAWTSGCARGTTEAPPQPGAVWYIDSGWVLREADANLLGLADEKDRLQEFSRRAAPVQKSFLVPRATFEWLFKQAAKARRLEEIPQEP